MVHGWYSFVCKRYQVPIPTSRLVDVFSQFFLRPDRQRLGKYFQQVMVTSTYFSSCSYDHTILIDNSETD
jgi:hypothetical protein